MSRWPNFFRVSIGKKAIVAITGIILVLFVIAHMLGNLKVYYGDDDGVPAIDVYAKSLRTIGSEFFGYSGVLWIVRGILIIAVVLHITLVIDLAIKSRQARPIGYKHRPKRMMASVASRLMMLSGLLLLIYIPLHILQFTTGTIVFGSYSQWAVYHNLYSAFSMEYWYVPLFYIIVMVCLGFHLYHGAWSVFQSLGWDSPDRNRGFRWLSIIVAIVVAGGFISLPALFWAGAMPEPTQSDSSKVEVTEQQTPVNGVSTSLALDEVR